MAGQGWGVDDFWYHANAEAEALGLPQAKENVFPLPRRTGRGLLVMDNLNDLLNLKASDPAHVRKEKTEQMNNARSAAEEALEDFRDKHLKSFVRGQKSSS